MQFNYNEYLTTTEFAGFLKLQSATVRRGLCVNGHFMGIRPIKLPNNRLLWPAAAIKQLLGQKDEARTAEGKI